MKQQHIIPIHCKHLDANTLIDIIKKEDQFYVRVIDYRVNHRCENHYLTLDQVDQSLYGKIALKNIKAGFGYIKHIRDFLDESDFQPIHHKILSILSQKDKLPIVKLAAQLELSPVYKIMEPLDLLVEKKRIKVVGYNYVALHHLGGKDFDLKMINSL